MMRLRVDSLIFAYLIVFNIVLASSARPAFAQSGAAYDGAVTVGGDLTVATDTLRVDRVLRRVGIGTPAPAGLLDIAGQALISSAGLVQAAAGSDTQPGFAFRADPDTGLFSAGSNILALAAGGAERARLDGAGQLSVTGPVAADAFMSANAATSSTLAGGLSVAGAAGLNVKANGTVGIGTSLPGAKLHVNTAGTAAIFGTGGGASTSVAVDHAWVGYNAATGNAAIQGASGKGIEFNVNNDTFGAGQKMLLTPTGNLGLGTTVPRAFLHLGIFSSSSYGTAIAMGQKTGTNYLHKIDCGINSSSELANYVSFNLARLGGSNNEVMRLIGDGRVGIGTASPAEKLHIVGNEHLAGMLSLDPISTATLGGLGNDGKGRIFALTQGGGVDVFAKSSDQSATQISSHRDPRTVAPAAQSSFGDPAVALPFSFHHRNALIGKGEVVDMAKLVAWAEKKMQAELGAEGGRLVFVYDLPTSQRLTLDEYQIAQVTRKLEAAPWVKVALKAGEAIPAEAVEEVDEVKQIERTIASEEKSFNLETMRVEAIKTEKTVTEKMATGKRIRRLREGWEIREGELWRRPKLSEMDLDGMVKNTIAPPSWIMDRIEGARRAGLSGPELIEELRRMQARAGSAEEPKAVAQN